MLWCLFILVCAFSSVLSKSPSVLIIGAGASGIAAATKLLENSINDITILEAENRIGGRVYSVPIEGGYVDIGAEFCHGQEGNVVYDLVKDLDLLRSSNGSTSVMYRSDGSQVDSSLAEEIAELINNYDGVIDKSTYRLSVGESFMSTYNSTILEKYKRNRKNLQIAVEALHLAEHAINLEESSFSWHQSAAGRHFQNCEGDDEMSWKNGGYNTILKVLTKSIPNFENKLPLEDKVHLNKQVTKINWHGKKAQVETSDNTLYIADHVIFTPSVGVLQHGNVLFDPPLPEKKLWAIDSLGMDAIMKIILHFPERWWKSNSNFLFVWSADDIAKSGEELTRGHSKDGVSWVTDILCLTQGANPNVLVAWVSGGMLSKIEETPEHILKEGVMFVIKKFLGKDHNVIQPSKIIISQWYSNPNFRGSYSYEKKGNYRTDMPRQAIIAEPLLNYDGKPIVQFAGEATNTIHYSTVHGAIETGWREADRIISYRISSIINYIKNELQ